LPAAALLASDKLKRPASYADVRVSLSPWDEAVGAAAKQPAMGEALWVGLDVPVSSIAVSSRAPALLPLTLQVGQLFLNGLHLVLQVVQIQLEFGNLLGLGLEAPPEAAFA
jgi:hypothetical protein